MCTKFVQSGGVEDLDAWSPVAPPSIASLPPMSTPDPSGRTPLAPGQVHIWYARPTSDGERLARYQAVMSAEERERGERFVFARDRELFALARALIRDTLSRYAAPAPAQWRFATGSHGKPRIAGPGADAGLRFNLSHTHGLVACAITRVAATGDAGRHMPANRPADHAEDDAADDAGDDIGIDVEDIARIRDPETLADRFFSPDEAAALGALPPARRRTRFFAYWTLKESYIKARGLGLAIPLDQFSFALGADHGALRIRTRFHPALDDVAARWRHALFRVGPRHLLAITAPQANAPQANDPRANDPRANDPQATRGLWARAWTPRPDRAH